jgi:ATP-dependent Clp protease ATP-binding subunit ClpC
MFERLTERARRVLFFARYEASQLGSLSIETEHLLLGLLREGKGLTSRIFAGAYLSLDSIRKDIEGRTVLREKVSTSPSSKRHCCTTRGSRSRTAKGACGSM